MTGGGLPLIAEHNASASGTDLAGYMTESPGFSAFVSDDGAVYHPTRRPGADWSS